MLSGFELYPRWVPLIKIKVQLALRRICISLAIEPS